MKNVCSLVTSRKCVCVLFIGSVRRMCVSHPVLSLSAKPEQIAGYRPSTQSDSSYILQSRPQTPPDRTKSVWCIFHTKLESIFLIWRVLNWLADFIQLPGLRAHRDFSNQSACWVYSIAFLEELITGFDELSLRVVCPVIVVKSISGKPTLKRHVKTNCGLQSAV